MHFMKRNIKLFIMLQNLALTFGIRESDNHFTRNGKAIDESLSKHDINSDESYESDSDDQINDKDIVSMLEERYKFLNDNTSTRYHIRNDERLSGNKKFLNHVPTPKICKFLSC